MPPREFSDSPATQPVKGADFSPNPGELLQGIQDFAIIRLDSSGHIVEWAAGSEKLFGYAPEEALGRHISLIFTSTDIAKGAPEAEMQIAATQERAEDTRWHLKKSGACFFANGIMNPLRDNQGHLIGFVKVLRDNSAQKKILDELADKTLALNAEKRKFEQIFESSPAAMVLWKGPDFVFEKVNPQYQAIFEGRELKGKPFLEALPEFKGQAFESLLKKVYETGERFEGHEMLARHPRKAGGEDEDFYYDFTYSRIEDSNGNPYGIYDHAIDVTDRVCSRKREEKIRQEIERKVEELDEERALRERFINTLTHDLRTPLTTAKMSAQLALRYRESPEKRERLLLRVIEAVERTDTMIGDLLDANRIKAGEHLPLNFSHCDLAFVIENCLEENRLLYGERFRLERRGKCEGYWSHEGLRRVIDNLLNNAVKYGSADAPIDITLECEPEGTKLTVHNEGEGLQPEEVDGLFKLFSRTKTAQSSGKRGWGIGLTLVKGIVDAHGGRVWAESAPGRGATFHVQLPRDFRAARSR